MEILCASCRNLGIVRGSVFVRIILAFQIIWFYTFLEQNRTKNLSGFDLVYWPIDPSYIQYNLPRLDLQRDVLENSECQIHRPLGHHRLPASHINICMIRHVC
jgi:hypothetical protein